MSRREVSNRERATMRREELDTESPEMKNRRRIKRRAIAIVAATQNRNLLKAKRLIQASDAHEVVEYYKRELRTPIIYTLVNTFLSSYPYRGDRVTSNQWKSILRALISAGADINESVYSGFSFKNALMVAIMHRNIPFCKLLLRMGADVNFPWWVSIGGTDVGYFETPFSKSVSYGADVVAFLMKNNAKLTEYDDCLDSGSAMFNAIHCTRRPDVLELFMDWYDTSDRTFAWDKAIRSTIDLGKERHMLAILKREYHLWHNEHQSLHAKYLKAACRNDFLRVVRLLINQYPPILHKRLIRRKMINTTKDKQFVRLLLDMQTKPFSLHLICKINILRDLGPKPQALISQLPLPDLIKDYLNEKVL